MAVRQIDGFDSGSEFFEYPDGVFDDRLDVLVATLEEIVRRNSDDTAGDRRLHTPDQVVQRSVDHVTRHAIDPVTPRPINFLPRRSGFVDGNAFVMGTCFFAEFVLFTGTVLVARRDGLEHQRRVANRTGHRTHMVHGGHKLHDAGLADQPVGRLVSDNAAALRGQADGTAGVGAERREGHPRRHGHGGAAAGATRMIVRPPRVSDGAEERVHRRGAEGQFVQPGLAQGDCAGLAEGRDHGRILVGHMLGVVPGPVGGQHAPGVDEVLDRDRNAVQQAAVPSRRQLAISPRGLFQRLVGCHRDERIQKPVQKLDPR